MEEEERQRHERPVGLKVPLADEKEKERRELGLWVVEECVSEVEGEGGGGSTNLLLRGGRQDALSLEEERERREVVLLIDGDGRGELLLKGERRMTKGT